MTAKVLVYCPAGCNVTEVASEKAWDECSACGRKMTPDGEGGFYQYREDIPLADFEGEESS